MNRLIKNKTVLFIALLIILLIPTFWRMLKPGIFSTQDFHPFRLYEYDKCISDLQIPCRWAPDAAFGFGEPVFNFYGQLVYLFGEVFRLTGLSVLNSIKGLFITSLIFSGIGMFFLSRQIWKNNLAGLISALVYTFAPYRAVDIYVRGALPEAFAFVFFPIIVYFFNRYVQTKENRSLLFFILSLAALLLTHNLSAFMFLIFLSVWGGYLLWKEKAWHLIPKFLVAGILVLGLSAFYLLPTLAESSLVTLSKTTQGYFNYQNHFATLKQLLISRYWGYGASVWGDGDGLSLSVGQIQWILPIIIIVLLIFLKKFKKYENFFILFFLGWFFLWLTHNKSTFVWNHLTLLAYVQFPWRFLGSAVFTFSLASGLLMVLIKRSYSKFILASVVIAALIALNTGYFFEDLWFSINDQQQFSGARYKEQTSASINDYWPVFGKNMPQDLAPQNPIFLQGNGTAKLIEKRSNRAKYQINMNSSMGVLEMPITYFPGWNLYVNNIKQDVFPGGELGLITANIKKGESLLDLRFEDTQVRKIGNYISLVSIVAVGLFVLVLKRKYE